MPELNLRCPNIKCQSENIIWARVPGPTCKAMMSPYGICRECWTKDRIEKFQEEYEKHHDTDGEPEWTAEMKYAEFN